MTRNISLFHADNLPGYNPVILQMDTGIFMQLVGIAGIALIDSSNFSDDELADNLSRLTERAMSVYDMRNFLGHVGIIEQYAIWRNASKKTDTWHVGEEHHLIHLVYDAMVSANNYKVTELDKSFAKDGYHFGSATGWHNHDLMELVKDWPNTYGFVDTKPVAVMPKKREVKIGMVVYATVTSTGGEVVGTVVGIPENDSYMLMVDDQEEIVKCRNPVARDKVVMLNGRQISPVKRVKRA